MLMLGRKIFVGTKIRRQIFEARDYSHISTEMSRTGFRIRNALLCIIIQPVHQSQFAANNHPVNLFLRILTGRYNPPRVVVISID